MLGEFTIDLNAAGGAEANGKFRPLSIDELPVVQDGVAGSGPNDTVELVTTSRGTDGQCPAGFQTDTFCGNVTLRHFFSRTLNNVFVQITAITDVNGNDLSATHGAVNSDPSQFGLSNTIGLWKYTSPGAAASGAMGTAPNNSGARDWVFADPDGVRTTITGRVVASLSYVSYVRQTSNLAFIDACAGGTDLGKPTTNQLVALPFGFHFYDSNSTQVRFNKLGLANVVGNNVTTTGNNAALPTVNAPRPAAFAFWDAIDYGTGATSKLCRGTFGAAPARRFVITWTDMNFDATVAAADKPSSMTFSMVFEEATDKVILQYNSMTGPAGRTRFRGTSATVGVQNAAGNAATSTFNNGLYTTGTAFEFVPVP